EGTPREEGGGLRPPRRRRPGPAAREQGGAVGIDGEADDDPHESRLQRVLLRLPDVLEAPGGCVEEPGRHPQAGRPERDLRHRRDLRRCPHRRHLGCCPSPPASRTAVALLAIGERGPGASHRRSAWCWWGASASGRPRRRKGPSTCPPGSPSTCSRRNWVTPASSPSTRAGPCSSRCPARVASWRSRTGTDTVAPTGWTRSSRASTSPTASPSSRG